LIVDNREIRAADFSINPQPGTISQLPNFSAKRRMRPAQPACAGWDSSDAFIPRFARVKAFLLPLLGAGLSTQTRPLELFSADKLKDQPMKIRLLPLAALASCLFVSINPTRATTIVENFSSDPTSSAWSVYGNPRLFAWNATNHNLEVTWDSSQPNSYFTRALGTNLTKASDFMLGFDVRLNDIGPGADVNKPFTFQIAIGLINLTQATNTGFIRASGFEAPNLVEFDYFWDSGFGATVSPVLISGLNEYNAGGFTFPLELATGPTFQVTLLYTAEDRTLRTMITSNGIPFGPVQDATLGTNFSDFTVDHFGVSSFNDAGQFPGYEGSVLAHGLVDNFVFAAPPPVTRVAATGPGQIQFHSTTNWLYSLERTTNFQSWLPVSAHAPGIAGTMTMQDPNPPSGSALYRVQAQLP